MPGAVIMGFSHSATEPFFSESIRTWMQMRGKGTAQTPRDWRTKGVD